MLKRMMLTLVALALMVGVADWSSASAATAKPLAAAAPAHAAAEDTEEVILPSRVANLIARTNKALSKATEHVDEAEYTKAIVSLRAVRRSLTAADKAARRAMNAVPADPEAEGVTTGPDSVIAVLTLDQQVITGLAELLNGQSGSLVGAIGTTMTAAQNTRDKLVDAVIALDPEGAADYADGMADTVDSYTDEVSNISDTLADDTLSAGGKSVLNTGLAKSQATAAKILAAFGGGE
jgi:hypothetical protein